MLKPPKPLSEVKIPQHVDVTLNNLSFSYGGVTVFSGLSLTAHIRRYYRSDRPGCLRKIHIRAGVSL